MLAEPRCWERKCKHYTGVYQTDGTEETEVFVCLAFPTGIPNVIAYGDDLHDVVRKSQVGSYTFEKE
jgi:hypothetical protein